MEVLGREIRSQLLGLRPLASPPVLALPARVPAPPPEALLPVPREFRALAGRHQAHPGTGKGYQAAAKLQSAVR